MALNAFYSMHPGQKEEQGADELDTADAGQYNGGRCCGASP